jgi:hypothetical protein
VNIVKRDDAGPTPVITGTQPRRQGTTGNTKEYARRGCVSACMTMLDQQFPEKGEKPIHPLAKG